MVLVLVAILVAKWLFSWRENVTHVRLNLICVVRSYLLAYGCLVSTETIYFDRLKELPAWLQSSNKKLFLRCLENTFQGLGQLQDQPQAKMCFIVKKDSIDDIEKPKSIWGGSGM